MVFERPEKYGGTVYVDNKAGRRLAAAVMIFALCSVCATFEELREKFASEEIHPGDLKKAVAKALDDMIEPVRAHFRDNKEARDLLKQVQGFRISR